MAKGKKRSRSLLELMDPAKDYRPSVPVQVAPETPAPAKIQSKAKDEVRVKSEVKSKPEPASSPKASQAETVEPQARQVIEPVLTAANGRVTLVLNYPLAIMVCFAAIIILICAYLVGWKIGRDNAARKYYNSRPAVEHRLPGMGSGGPSGGSGN